MSLGIDLGLGQPMEHVIRSTLIAMRLGSSLGLGDGERAALYYISLLAWVGCGADSYELARWFGDDIQFRADAYRVDTAGLPMAALIVRRVGSGRLGRARAVRSLATGIHEVNEAHCAAASAFAERLELGPEVREPLYSLFERWDGRGPRKQRGEAVPQPIRIVQLADIVAFFHREEGVEGAVAVARARRAKQFDPALVDHFCASAADFCEALDGTANWDAVIEAEPVLREPLPPELLERALHALADFTDLKSPSTMGHARGVADLAEEAGRRLGLPEDEVRMLRRAALLQDLGRMGVSNAILDKPASLSAAEMERVRLHPYFTERMLARPPALARIGAIASQHHERLDGSGYPRGLVGAALGPAARILAATDVYRALIEERPHRPPLPAGEARPVLQAEVKAGRLDGDAVNAVLAAAGHRVRARRAWPAGLTPREVEVLGLLARGYSNREVARRLSISAKTVGNHVEHIYAKIGASSRAEAGLFAMQHGLLDMAAAGGPSE